MELATLKPQERTIEIKHPSTGENLGVRVRIMSMDDDRLKTIKREITDQRLKLEQRNKAFKADDIEANGRRLLFKATLGWEWYNPTGSEGDEGYSVDAMPSFNGEVPEYNQRNFVDVVSAIPWFAKQINEELDDEKAFFDNSKTN